MESINSVLKSCQFCGSTAILFVENGAKAVCLSCGVITLLKAGCDDFHCCFVGTKLCITENCGECKLKNCRGCEHLEECFDEMMEV